jgi:hypothetical protein
VRYGKLSNTRCDQIVTLRGYDTDFSFMLVTKVVLTVMPSPRVRRQSKSTLFRLLPCQTVGQQLSPHQIQWLAHGEVKTPIDRALWSPIPQAPCPPRPSAVSALASSVDSVLAQQQDHTHKQPDCVLFESCWCGLLFFCELVSERFNPFQKHAAASLPDVAHGSE